MGTGRGRRGRRASSLSLISLALVASSAGASSGAAAQRVSVRVMAEEAGLTLHRLTGTHSVPVMTGNVSGIVQVSDYALLCTAPCTTELSAESHSFGVSRGRGNPVRAGGPIHLYGSDLLLDIRYEDRSAIRIAGVITWIVGAVGGAILAGTSVLTGPRVCLASGRVCYNDINVPQLIAGSIIAGLSIAIGVPLTFFVGDAADVTLRPGGAATARRGRREEDDEPRTASGSARTSGSAGVRAPAGGASSTSGSSAAGSATSASTWSDDVVRALLRDVHDDVLACFSAERDGVHVRVTLTERGTVSYSRVMDTATPAEAACVTARLARVAIDGHVSVRRLVMLRFTRSAAAGEETVEDAPAEGESGEDGSAAASGEEPPSGVRDVPAEVRAMLDARRAAILACVESAAIGVAASWTPDGALSVTLRGARVGSPEDACVAAVFDGVRIDPAPSEPGSLIHAVSAE